MHRFAMSPPDGAKASEAAIDMVSAFAVRRRIMLGQVKVNDKTWAIVAIPALRDMMSIEGVVLLESQREIAGKITNETRFASPRSRSRRRRSVRWSARTGPSKSRFTGPLTWSLASTSPVP